ncbi:BTB/POZ domain-containing protein KCTD21-like isoform X3 [Erpetoichthys calabaricus]|uniref:BTB/POZ domain-containing protein KCTD21-like isoform X3 n=1 Tax=Erpetoichthys calabaricus TaxID=27687 RepID=UPI00109EE852|nr:BTB/POZ domain-containing protein KCTD21-like isoform X3 [Erpetoichthys calabaricus]
MNSASLWELKFPTCMKELRREPVFSYCWYISTEFRIMSELVTLNVGGKLYTTSRATLACYPDSMLGAMFSGKLPSSKDSQGNCFIDRDVPAEVPT